MFGESKKENAENEDKSIFNLRNQIVYIDFTSNSSLFTPEGKVAIEDFVDSAKKLDGSIIEIRGYELNKDNLVYAEKLLNQRIKTITSFFEQNQIDLDRLVIVNDESENNNKNSKVSIAFKAIE